MTMVINPSIIQGDPPSSAISNHHYIAIIDHHYILGNHHWPSLYNHQLYIIHHRSNDGFSSLTGYVRYTGALRSPGGSSVQSFRVKGQQVMVRPWFAMNGCEPPWCINDDHPFIDRNQCRGIVIAILLSTDLAWNRSIDTYSNISKHG